MAIVYTDPTVVLARYAPYEPIIDAYQADVIEGLQFLWRRHAQAVLQYVPQVPWETTSGTFSATGSNDTDPLAERLTVFPMTPGAWRADVSDDVQLTVVLVGTMVGLTIEVYEGTTLVDNLVISVGAGPAVDTGSLTLPSGTGDVWFRILGNRNAVSGTGELFAVYVFSNLTASAPK
jgi:hypothetical protein